jgi:hypothetical protein
MSELDCPLAASLAICASCGVRESRASAVRLVDPVAATEAVRKSAAELDAWHGGGRQGSRPAGRLRNHVTGVEGGLPARHRWFTAPVYRSFLDPDGRPMGMRLRRTY